MRFPLNKKMWLMLLISALLSVGVFTQPVHASACLVNSFCTTWQTTAPNESITIPTTGAGYNYSVDWGDGQTSVGQVGNATHSYAIAGTYTVSITGTFPRIYFNDAGHKDKIKAIKQWGTIAWTSMNNAFKGCTFVVGEAIDVPNLTGVTNLSGMFQGAAAFNQDISGWDVSNVTNMRGMFENASAFNNGGQPLTWGAQTSNVTNMNRMFGSNFIFNQDISGWDVSSVTDMGGMFQDAFLFNQDISGWDVSSVTNMKSTFNEAFAFNQDISSWNVSGVTDMSFMFYSAAAFNQNIGGWNVSGVTNMSNMFEGALVFDQNIGGWNISNVGIMDSMLSGVTLSMAHYDALLVGWSGQSVQPNLNFDGGNSLYCSAAGAAGRNVLSAAPNNWSIIDGGIGCSSDATLQVSSTIKGVAVADLGTPDATLASVVASGTVTLTAIQAADISNAGSYITAFLPTDGGAVVTRVVKYATGADTTNFATDVAYANGAVADQNFFVVEVTAADTGRLYYKIVATVISDDNPVPTITSISSNTATAGASAFTMSVTGTNFIASSVLRWNGSDRVTTYVSPTELTASILLSDLSSAGVNSIAIFNPLPGGGTSTASVFTVTAVVPPAPPAGGAGGGNAGDVTPPVLSNIQAVNITTSTAQITWTTDEAADSKVEYGLSNVYGKEISDAPLVVHHQITLPLLTSSTTYHVRVTSRDVVGNKSVSEDVTFTTVGIGAPPVAIILSKIQTLSITTSSAQMTWQTSVSANSRVEYGLTSAYGTVLSDAALTPLHAVVLTGLSPLTTYHVQVSSQADGMVGATSSDFFFTTLNDQPAPPIVPGVVSATPTAPVVPPQKLENTVLRCSNDIDDDIDGLVDCDDSDCGVFAVCSKKTPPTSPKPSPEPPTPPFVSGGNEPEELPPIESPIATEPTSSAPVVPQKFRLRNAQSFMQDIRNRIADRVHGVRVILQQPAVQHAVQNTISPTVLGVAVANAATALPLFNSLAYLQYIFLQPVLLLDRRKRKKWGVIYNALTKQPIELAIIRLLYAETRTVAQTRVSDKLGRYGFSVKPGTYLLEVVKPGFAFPTQFLQDASKDGEYLDVYHGVPITFTQEGVIDMNIPVDPAVPDVPPRKIIWQKRLRHIQESLALTTVVLAMGGVFISPTPKMGFILLAQVATYLFFKRLSVSKKIPDWGAIIDHTSKQPLAQVVVRIFDKKFNKVLETQVTDKNGKYGFFVRRNVYYVTAEKATYKKYISTDIDLTNTDEAMVDQNIIMQHAILPAPEIPVTPTDASAYTHDS